MALNNSELLALAKRSQVASRELATTDTKTKNSALVASAMALQDSTYTILAENEKDIENAKQNGIADNLIDRLRLTQDRIMNMASGLEKVANLPDPIGEVVHKSARPNGLQVEQIRVPLGVVAIIYESRPNVTSDSAGLCLKSSNAAFLRGSAAAIHSNIALEGILREAISSVGISPDAVILLKDTDYQTAIKFMQLRQYVDCLIPRGGPKLIASILENATVPYIIDGDGNCHIYVDEFADLKMAAEVVKNAKTQRTSVCNAAESLVVHKSVAGDFLPSLVGVLDGVELVGDEPSRKIAPEISPATDEDFAKEFLDLKLSIKVVDSLDDAIAHINLYNSKHSEAIITEDEDSAKQFIAGVDSGSILVNASTRFIDGEELGFGAEIGISTQKLHARGPLGLKQLSCLKFVVKGSGQIRN